jgi:hypothetical protein
MRSFFLSLILSVFVTSAVAAAPQPTDAATMSVTTPSAALAGKHSVVVVPTNSSAVVTAKPLTLNTKECASLAGQISNELWLSIGCNKAK